MSAARSTGSPALNDSTDVDATCGSMQRMSIGGIRPYDKIVILEFPAREDAARFRTAPEYTEIAKDRKAGAEATVIVAETIP